MPIPPPRRKRSLPVTALTKPGLTSGAAGITGLPPTGNDGTLRRQSTPAYNSTQVLTLNSSNVEQFDQRSKVSGTDAWSSRVLPSANPYSSGTSSDLSLDYLNANGINQHQVKGQRKLKQTANSSNSMNRRRNMSLHDISIYDQMGGYPQVFSPPPFGHYPPSAPMAYGHGGPWGMWPSMSQSMEDVHRQQLSLHRDESSEEFDEEEPPSQSVNRRSATLTRGQSVTSKSGRNSSATMKRSTSNSSFASGHSLAAWAATPPPPNPYYYGPYGNPPPGYYPNPASFQAPPSPPASHRSSFSTTSRRRRQRAQSIDDDSPASSNVLPRREGSGHSHGREGRTPSKPSRASGHNGHRRASSKSRSQVSMSSRYIATTSDESEVERQFQMNGDEEDDEEFYSVSGDERPRSRSGSKLRDDGSRPWTCKYCTFVNAASLDVCDICSKSSPRKLKKSKVAALDNARRSSTRDPTPVPPRPVTPAVNVLPQDNGLEVNESLIREQLDIEAELLRRAENAKRIEFENEQLERELVAKQGRTDGLDFIMAPAQEVVARVQQCTARELDGDGTKIGGPLPRPQVAVATNVSHTEMAAIEVKRLLDEKIVELTERLAGHKIATSTINSDIEQLANSVVQAQGASEEQYVNAAGGQPHVGHHIQQQQLNASGCQLPQKVIQTHQFQSQLVQAQPPKTTFNGQQLLLTDIANAQFFGQQPPQQQHINDAQLCSQIEQYGRRGSAPFEGHQFTPISDLPVYRSNGGNIANLIGQNQQQVALNSYNQYVNQRSQSGSTVNLASIGQSYGQPSATGMTRYVSQDDIRVQQQQQSPLYNHVNQQPSNTIMPQQLASGMELIKVIREAERLGYNADDIEIACNFNPTHPLG